MSKNPSEGKGMPGERQDMNRDTQQGQRKEGQKGTGTPDWKKGKDQQQPRKGELMGNEPKQIDPSKRHPGGSDAGSDTEETDDRKRRPA